jgi:hypothetical protein
MKEWLRNDDFETFAGGIRYHEPFGISQHVESLQDLENVTEDHVNIEGVSKPTHRIDQRQTASESIPLFTDASGWSKKC